MGEEPTKPAEVEPKPPPTPETKPEKSYNQADVDAITEKVRKGLNTKLDAQTKQLEELKTANLSEQEKAVEDAKKVGLDEGRAELEVFKRQATIERLLAAKGVTNAEQVARLIDADADPDEGVAKLAEDMPQLFTTTKVGGGGGRSLTPEGGQAMSEEHVNDMVQQHGPGWLTTERLAKLKQWRIENQSSIRRLNT